MIKSVTKTWPIKILSDDAERADLAKRRETKFALPGVDVAKLRRMLASNCRKQVHRNDHSLVSSVYFDDHRMSACYANLDGLTSRRKLRLRWYDSVLPPEHAVLEIKWRENRVTGKHRLHLHAEDGFQAMDYRDLKTSLASCLHQQRKLERHLAALNRFYQPTLLVRYRREHFVSRDGTVRLTLDYDLEYVDQRGRIRFGGDFAVPLRNLVVLECKTTVGAETELRKLIHPFSIRPSRCSKYVMGCQELGLVKVCD